MKRAYVKLSKVLMASALLKCSDESDAVILVESYTVSLKTTYHCGLLRRVQDITFSSSVCTFRCLCVCV